MNAGVQNSVIFVGFCLIKGVNGLQKLTYRLNQLQAQGQIQDFSQEGCTSKE